MIRVKAAFFSLTPPAPPDDDGSYLRWHLLDHMVEQYQLPGIQFALRYIADGEYLARRIVASGHVEDVGNVVNYLVGDPVQQTHNDFMQLGPRLAEVGRFPEVLCTTNTWNRHPTTQGDPQYTTVISLDEDPLTTTEALTPVVEERWRSGAVRPLFAGPLRTMIDWEAWR